MPKDSRPVILIVEDDADDVAMITAGLTVNLAGRVDIVVEHVMFNDTELVNAKIRGSEGRVKLVIVSGLHGQNETVIRVIKGQWPQLAVIATSGEHHYIRTGLQAGANHGFYKSDFGKRDVVQLVVLPLIARE